MQSSSVARPPAVDPNLDIRVDCYVRSTVPGPIAETIDIVVDRLDRLTRHGRIADYEITLWPPSRASISEAIDRGEQTREELLATFERWADRNGYRLDPAFRREDVPMLPFGSGFNASRERVRVPIVALVVREEGASATEPDADALRGVIPCTEPRRGDDRTYTVEEWLSALERRQRSPSAGRLSVDGPR